ncbi:MAG: MerR family transcriptional regulator [Burkholderiaceae bacterium]|nr:MerR family transcriptional regulator [Burkholderiaceae bacterium]
MPESLKAVGGWSIAAVERDTGLSKDTLRVWERRYGFPRPRRDALGERVYSQADVGKLRLVKRLLDQGHRPGRIVTLSVEELRQLALDAGREGTAALPEPGFEDVLRLLRAHRIETLRAELTQTMARLGLARFVAEVVAPLTARVGEAWARGECEVFEEHLYTECVQSVLRAAIAAVAVRGMPPRVLLTTVPQETHGLGLLMAEAMLTVEGCECIPLGVGTPLPDIVAAARAQAADVVGLSFSACLPAPAVVASLTELRARLPRAVALWVGGSNAALRRRTLPAVQVFQSLAAIAPAVVAWRAGQRP